MHKSKEWRQIKSVSTAHATQPHTHMHRHDTNMRKAREEKASYIEKTTAKLKNIHQG